MHTLASHPVKVATALLAPVRHAPAPVPPAAPVAVHHATINAANAPNAMVTKVLRATSARIALSAAMAAIAAAAPTARNAIPTDPIARATATHLALTPNRRRTVSSLQLSPSTSRRIPPRSLPNQLRRQQVKLPRMLLLWNQFSKPASQLRSAPRLLL